MPVPVVADADTLFGATTRGLLIYLDYAGLIRLHWSPLILDELGRALLDAGRKPDRMSVDQHTRRMLDALPAASISTARVQAQFHRVCDGVRSAKDMHVAACASVLVAHDYYPAAPIVMIATRNLVDFDADWLLREARIRVLHCDAFLMSLLEEDGPRVARAFQQFRLDLASNPTPGQLLLKLHSDGQVDTAAALRKASCAGVLAL